MGSPEFSRVPGKGDPAEPVHVIHPQEGYRVGDTVIPDKDIQARITELGIQIAKDYEGKELVLVGILIGGDATTVAISEAVFNAGHTTHKRTYLWLHSYGPGLRSGRMRVVKGADKSVLNGADAVIVDDVRETVRSLGRAEKEVGKVGAKTVEKLVLIDKAHGSESHPPRYVGFIVGEDVDGEKVWLEGKGMDSWEGGRGNRNVIKGPMYGNPPENQ